VCGRRRGALLFDAAGDHLRHGTHQCAICTQSIKSQRAQIPCSETHIEEK
jgi:hypothetical protein